jgi:hypothetical protein
MGSTLRSITLRSVTWCGFLYICIVFYTFLSFLFYGRVVIYVFFFTVADVK